LENDPCRAVGCKSVTNGARPGRNAMSLRS